MQQVVRWLIYCGVADTQKGIAQRAGYNETVFSAVLNGSTPLSYRFVQRVCALDHRLLPDWVMTGHGEMLRLSRNASRRDHGRPERSIPYYPELPVSCGAVDAPPYDDEVDYVHIPGVHAEAFFTVSGCSMQPTVYPGDLIGVVSMDGMERIDPECIYMIITRENERMLKHILPTSPDDPEITLSSDNPNYPPFRRLKDEIYKIFRVVYVGRMM